jgi:hypothetical protein
MLTAGEVRHWLRALVARCETAEQTPSAGEAALVIRAATAEARVKRLERNWQTLEAWLDPRLSIMIRTDRVIDKMAEITKEQT